MDVKVTEIIKQIRRASFSLELLCRMQQQLQLLLPSDYSGSISHYIAASSYWFPLSLNNHYLLSLLSIRFGEGRSMLAGNISVSLHVDVDQIPLSKVVHAPFKKVVLNKASLNDHTLLSHKKVV